MDFAISNEESIYQFIANELVKITPNIAITSRQKTTSNENIVSKTDSLPSISELLINTAPFLIRVRKLSDLAAEIKKSHDANPWGLRDYGLTYKITVLLDEILEEYWDNFPINSKIDLLSRLEPLNKALSTSRNPLSFLKYMFSELAKNPVSTIQTFWRSILALSKLIVCAIFDKTAFREISATAILNNKAQSKIQLTIQRIIEKDYYLIGSSHMNSAINENHKPIVTNSSIDFRFDDLSENREINRQQKLFKQLFSEIIDKYPNQYILFDNGKVIDHDKDSDKLLERIFKTDFVKQRTGRNNGLYCYFIPNSVFESETKEYRRASSKFMMDLWIKESASTNLEDYSQEELNAMQRVQDRLMLGE
jgi:Family of unknown function (DUF5678)